MKQPRPIIRYIRRGNRGKRADRTYQKGEAKAEPIGVVVALDAKRVGWSLCKWCDGWDGALALDMAIQRAVDRRYTRRLGAAALVWGRSPQAQLSPEARTVPPPKVPFTVVPFCEWAIQAARRAAGKAARA